MITAIRAARDEVRFTVEALYRGEQENKAWIGVTYALTASC